MQQELQALQDQPAQPDRQAPQDQLDLLDQLALKDYKAWLVLQDQLDQLVRREWQGRLALQERLATRELPVVWGQQVRQVQRDRQEQLAQAALLARLVQLDPLVRRVTRE